VKFGYLKVGDTVTRMLGGSVAMRMQVTAVSDDLITCAAIDKESGKLFYGDWTFDRNSGVEEDADLQWGIKFGHTGSYLVREDA
jgi:hypothetical protein